MYLPKRSHSRLSPRLFSKPKKYICPEPSPEIPQLGALHLCCAGELDILIFDKNSTFFIVSYFSLGGLEFCLGIKPTRTPRGDGTVLVATD